MRRHVYNTIFLHRNALLGRSRFSPIVRVYRKDTASLFNYSKVEELDEWVVMVPIKIVEKELSTSAGSFTEAIVEGKRTGISRWFFLNNQK